MSVKHIEPVGGFTGNRDYVDPNRITIRDWLEDHPHPAFMIYSAIAINQAGWAVPSARTEIFGRTDHRTRYVLQYADRVRLLAGIRSPGGKGTISLQYSTDGVTWGSLDGLGGPSISCARYGSVDSGWRALSPTVLALGAADLRLRLVGEGGDGVTKTLLQQISIYVH